MPLFGGHCTGCEQSVYFWVSDLGGHDIASASLVLHPEQPNRGGVINNIWAICDITGLHVYGLPDRRRIERHSSRPGLRRVQRGLTLFNGETIDLTQDSSGEEEGYEGASESVLHESGVSD